MKKRIGSKKGSVITDYLPWIIIGVVILVMLMIAIAIQTGVLDSYIDKIKNPFRGG